MEGSHGAGKGDSYRSVDMKKYAENYEQIFSKKKKKGKKNERTNQNRPSNKQRGTNR